MSRILVSVTTMMLVSQAVVAQEAGMEAVIRRALSAAPAAVAENASVMDLEGNMLRQGTNGYTCYPSMPRRDYPMCVDEPYLKWIEALWGGIEPPPPPRMAFGYWLQGTSPLSNEDPFATEAEMASQVRFDGAPHVAILMPDRSLLDALPTDPTNGGPWVMWKDTPYAHIMVPAPRRKE